ncbi:MAG: large conductance mechanosensitive channel protein MscL [Pleurocapsa sp. SU_196_0]|nr:large conductance mechanosensitive channel protein MscL [Pleurocapsa sp. SU_196_0]
MLDGFKNFLLRGNVVDLAVGVIIGAAFGAIVDSLVKDVITPIIGLIGGTPDFSSIKLGPINIGNFINALVAFIIKAAALYFIVVIPMQRAMALMKKPEAAPVVTVAEDVKLLTEIRDLLSKQNR